MEYHTFYQKALDNQYHNDYYSGAEHPMPLTTDPRDPRLTHGVDTKPGQQAEVYLVLSEEERKKGFVRPLRHSYKHVGRKPKYPLRDLTEIERKEHGNYGYIKYEAYPESESPVVGCFWTQADLDKPSCRIVTNMGLALCETYARDPSFYGSTYCCGCGMHLPVNEFVWIENDGTEGPIVGS